MLSSLLRTTNPELALAAGYIKQADLRKFCKLRSEEWSQEQMEQAHCQPVSVDSAPWGELAREDPEQTFFHDLDSTVFFNHRKNHIFCFSFKNKSKASAQIG